MGLLDGDTVKNMIGAAFAPVFGTGSLIRVDMVLHPSGVSLPIEQKPIAVSVQVESCDETMRQSPGYTDQDARLIVLRRGVMGREPNSDDVVIARGQRWKCKSVRSDPARSYWMIHATRQATET